MNNRKNAVAGSITGLVALLATVAFLLIGFTTDTWHLAWVVFLLIPITGIIVDIATNRGDIVGRVTGMVALFATIGFFLLGFVWHMWHPGWIIFFAIPISGVIMKMIVPDASDRPGNGPDTRP